MTKQYSTDMLSAGDTFVVRGKTSFPRLTHVIDGDELNEEVKRATQQGRIPTTTPHSYTTLTDASIEFANPQAPTLAECYAAERIFINKEGKPSYTALRKSQTLAEYGVIDPADPTKVHGIYLDPNKTLANGLDVKCYFRVFDGKAGMHKGVSLDAIVFQEPVKYYEFSNAQSQLSARGIVWEQPVGEPPVYQPSPSVVPAYGQTSSAPVAPQPSQAVNQPAQTFAQTQSPSYGQAPVNAATQPVQPFANQMQAPVQPVVPQPAMPQMPVQPFNGMPAPVPAQPTQSTDPYSGNSTQSFTNAQSVTPAVPQPTPTTPPAMPQQTIGNAGTGSPFDGAYSY